MKKTYIHPALIIVRVATEGRILEGSLYMNNSRTVTGTNGGWVKSDRSRDSYNVWDDDWSN